MTDVLASTNIPEIFKVGQESKIKIKWETNNNQEVAFNAYDTNNNGKLDYVEWTIPHLSEQIFNIIFISKAFHLDQDLNIIEDIQEQVLTQDNTFATIQQNEYIRVTFEKILNNQNDNTIYAKPTDPNTPVTVESYPVYTDQEGNATQGPKVGTFQLITQENLYRILLTNLQTPTDQFDLKITGGTLDVDWVVDPAPTLEITLPASGQTYTSSTWPTPSFSCTGCSSGENTCEYEYIDIDNGFNYPSGITSDGTYIYVADYNNHRIVKRLASNLSYVSKIGTNGSGNDQFSSPRGITTDGTYLYVADSGNHRIVKRLASDLSYVSKIGTSGSGNDQFNNPFGITSDGTYIYVVDYSNHRIVKRLASDLSYVSKIGTVGSGNDQFIFPRGITTDGTYLYVADSGNHRIVKRLASDLSYVSKIGTQGSDNDQFNNPQGITTDNTYIYVADSGNHRIVKRLASDLSYVSKIGSGGSDNDQFSNPQGITSDGTYIYVADTSNHRIVKRLASDLSYVSKIGTYSDGSSSFIDCSNNGSDISAPSSPGSQTLYLKGSSSGIWSSQYTVSFTYISEYGESCSSGSDCTTSYCDTYNSVCTNGETGVDGCGADDDCQSNQCTNYICAQQTTINITSPLSGQIYKASTLTNSYTCTSCATGAGSCKYLDQQEANFSNPRGITTDGTYIYVADMNNHRIVRLASDLSYVSQIGTGGSGNDQFSYPQGITTDNTYIYVADSVNNRIVKRLASNLSYVSQIGTGGSGNDQFNYPFGITTDNTYIYVADRGNNRIVKRLASDLSYVSQIGTNGSGNDQFNYPFGITTDNTYIYVADTNNHRIVKRLASDLSYVSQIGTNGSGNDEFNAPNGITSDGTYIYVADRDNNRIVKRLASNLSYVSEIGTYGSGNDQFYEPYGITTDNTYIYVADANNDRIVKRLASNLSYVDVAGYKYIDCSNLGSDIVAPAISGSTTLSIYAQDEGGTWRDSDSVTYTYDAVNPTISVTRTCGAATCNANTWNPLVNWDDSTTCQYSYNNSAWTTVVCSNTGSDISIPTAEGSTTLYIKGTDAATNEGTANSVFTWSLLPVSWGGSVSVSVSTDNSTPPAPTTQPTTTTSVPQNIIKYISDNLTTLKNSISQLRVTAPTSAPQGTQPTTPPPTTPTNQTALIQIYQKIIKALTDLLGLFVKK
jgi:DNA-binding beta-propeller fold protein YncE